MPGNENSIIPYSRYPGQAGGKAAKDTETGGPAPFPPIRPFHLLRLGASASLPFREERGAFWPYIPRFAKYLGMCYN